LENLRNYAKHVSLDLYRIFLTPFNDLREKYLFMLLKIAYVDACHKKDFVITETELKEHIQKVTKMKQTIINLLPRLFLNKMYHL